MAATKPYAFLLLALLTLSFIINPSDAIDCVASGLVSVYWGQHTEAQEGSLKEACDSGNYDIVILQGLLVYDSGRTPILDLDGHCATGGGHCGTDECPCSHLEGAIKHCQELGRKIFLSIGDEKSTIRDRHSVRSSSSSSVSSSSLSLDFNVTQKLADYLLENFLSGLPGPLGSVTLDGIDIANVRYDEHLRWDELVRILKASTDRAISVAAQCAYPDRFLNATIATGLVDYVWVEFFYQAGCTYSNPAAFWLAWNTWTSHVPNSKIFLGLTASKSLGGYIESEQLKSVVLPRAKRTSKYGGVMIWQRYYDRLNDYSRHIKDSVPKVCRCVCENELAPTGFYSMLARSSPM